MNTFTQNPTIHFRIEICCNCGILFGVEADHQQQLVDYGKTFYCPSGHPQSYSKPRIKIIEEQLEIAQRDLRASKCETLAERQRRETTEAQKLRLEKRMRHGVCPHCNRSFTNLRRHMESKHNRKGSK